MNEQNDFKFTTEEAIKKYGELVCKLARLNMQTMQDAEDIFQDVFLKLFCNEEHINSEEHLKAWLIRVTVNECHSKARKAYRQYETSVGDISYIEKTACEEWDRHSEDDIYLKIKKLPARYREVVLLYYYEDYSIKEIAKLLDMNENTVKTRLKRAKQRLAAMIIAGVIFIIILLGSILFIKSKINKNKMDSVKNTYTSDNLKEDVQTIIPFVAENECIIKLPDGSEMIIEKGKLSVWECVDEENGSYVMKLDSYDVKKDKMNSKDMDTVENILRASLPEKQFIITDSSGQESECTAVQKEIGTDYYIYEITLYVDDLSGESFKTDWIKLDVKTDLDYGNPVIVGTNLRNKDGEYIMTEYQFKDGTVIHPFAFMRNIAYDEDGNILPFDKWEGMSEAYVGFAINGDISVKTVPLNNKNTVKYVFNIFDKDGNSYWSDISE